MKKLSGFLVAKAVHGPPTMEQVKTAWNVIANIRDENGDADEGTMYDLSVKRMYDLVRERLQKRHPGLVMHHKSEIAGGSK